VRRREEQKMKKFGLILLIPLLLYGQAKVGTAGVKFLSIGLSPVALGMGEAYVAVANDASSVFWNPAGLANVKGKAIFFGHTEWIVDTRLPAFVYITDIGTFGKLGFFVGGVYSSNFEEVRLTPQGDIQFTGKTFSYIGIQAGLSYARYFTDRFAVGVNLKGVYEGYGDYTNCATVALDAGTYFHTGWKTLRIAMSLQHLGPDMTPSGTYILWESKAGNLVETEKKYRSYPLPMVFRLGAAMEVYKDALHRVTIATEAVHPNDNVETIAFGTEYSFAELLFLRVGYNINKDEGGFSAGAGFAPGNISLDYSFSDFGSLPDIHRLGLSLRF
jgi:hypothetical protein